MYYAYTIAFDYGPGRRALGTYGAYLTRADARRDANWHRARLRRRGYRVAATTTFGPNPASQAVWQVEILVGPYI